MFTNILVIKQQSQETSPNKQDGGVYRANVAIRATLTELGEEPVRVNVHQVSFPSNFCLFMPDSLFLPFLYQVIFFKYSNGYHPAHTSGYLQDCFFPPLSLFPDSILLVPHWNPSQWAPLYFLFLTFTQHLVFNFSTQL